MSGADGPDVIKPPTKINVVIEYRMSLPFTLDEYKRGQLYTTAKSSVETTRLSTQAGDKCGVVVRKNLPEPELNPNVVTHGSFPDRMKYSEQGSQHTLKEIHFGKNLPRVVSACLPKEAKFVEERCWNSFPYVLTVYTSTQSYLSSRLFISVESMHFDDDPGEQENPFNLTGKDLEARSIIRIDIANEFVGAVPPDLDSPSSPASPAPHSVQGFVGDPRNFKSEKTGRGPLRGENWHKETKPVMTAYKLVKMVCDVPFHSKIERAVLKSAIFDMVLNTHKNLFCSHDEWIWLDKETIRAYEKAAFEAAAEALAGNMGPIQQLHPPQPPETKPEWVVDH